MSLGNNDKSTKSLHPTFNALQKSNNRNERQKSHLKKLPKTIVRVRSRLTTAVRQTPL